jgi:predicted CopG family antitoxin
MYTTIRIKEGTRERLEELKKKLNADSYDQVINNLLDGYTDPVRALELMIYWFVDIRNDVKEITNHLRMLDQVLHQ